MTPLYFLKIVFPKFDPLTVTGMALCVDLGPKCHSGTATKRSITQRLRHKM